MRNHDLRVFTQALAEFRALHLEAAAAQAPKLTEKELVKQARVLIRRKIINRPRGEAPEPLTPREIVGGGRGRGRGRGRGGGGAGGGRGRGRGRGGRGAAARAGSSDEAEGGAAAGRPARRPDAPALLPAAALAAAAADAGFTLNPLIAAARAAAEAAAGKRRAAASDGADAAGGGAAAAAPVHALAPAPEDDLEQRFHMHAAALVQQGLVSLAALATARGGAAQYVHFAGSSAREAVLVGGPGAGGGFGRGCGARVGVLGADPSTPAARPPLHPRPIPPTPALNYPPPCLPPPSRNPRPFPLP
jgi:hypothetical protein